MHRTGTGHCLYCKKKVLKKDLFINYCSIPYKTFELNIPNKAFLVIGLQTSKVCSKSKSKMAYSRPAIQFKSCSNKTAKKSSIISNSLRI